MKRLITAGISLIRLPKFDPFTFWIAAGTFMSWMAFWSLVFFSSPEAASLAELAIFYISLILSISGVFYLAGFYARKKIFKKTEAGDYAFNSLRQAILISLGFCGILGLAKFQILNVLTIFLIFGSLVFFELFLRTKT